MHNRHIFNVFFIQLDCLGACFSFFLFFPNEYFCKAYSITIDMKVI